ADRRLAEPEPLSGASDAALLDQRVEDTQQIEVESVKMRFIHICDAQLSFVCKTGLGEDAPVALQRSGDTGMSSLLKSTVLGLALLAGTTAAAYAQSVSALPPTSPATAPTAATPTYSASKILPYPGG